MMHASTSRSVASSSRCTRKQIPKGIGLQHLRSSPLKMPPSRICVHCRARIFAHEPPSMCCHSGEIVLAPFLVSDVISQLYARQDFYGEHFRQYSRVYNNFFAFSSLGGDLEAITRSGVHTLHLHGQLYHFLPNLLPSENGPNFLQMYFYDGALEFDSRMKGFGDLLPHIIQLLMRVTELNPYARFFRSLSSAGVSTDSKILISRNPVLDQRVYNAPSTDEVAVILVDSSTTAALHSPDILVHAHGNNYHRVLHYFGCYDPLQYPLLFCKGESGWHQGLRRSSRGETRFCHDVYFPIPISGAADASDLMAAEHAGASTFFSTSSKKFSAHSLYISKIFMVPQTVFPIHPAVQKRPRTAAKTISCREYYSYYFQSRSQTSIINMGRIFLQYILDMYVKIENTRLDFIRYNQAALRSELYQGIVDSVNDGVRNASSIGRRVILPASFIGGPRDMKRRYLNAMSLVQRFGKPDLFITMTCNPQWPEIQNELKPWETAQDRPDIVTRIFRSKVIQLKNEISRQKIFGSVAARVDVIEFQKRGLPHVHMLIILDSGSKILTPDTFDQYVSAELPPEETPLLRSLVKQHMVHGPCGDLNPRCACMKTKNFVSKCRSGYPKAYADTTTCTTDAYPIYRRRNNNDSVSVRGREMDNRWIVPYNPYLLSAFDCHINVEICSTIKAVKYIYKYVYKGHDRICFDIERNHACIEDETKTFQSARWVSPPEAAWRIFGFDLYDMQPPVFALQVHLPDMQWVSFVQQADVCSLIVDQNSRRTMLTEYFETNSLPGTDPIYLYREFPEFFVWDQRTKRWRTRKVRGSVGRMTYVDPSEGERYYLRLLLCNVRGATSYENLMTVDGIRAGTFKEACEQLGYLHRDDYADSCMEDAIGSQMPVALRRLFATLLVFVDGVKPLSMWNRFYSFLSEDYAHANHNNELRVRLLTYASVETHLESMGKRMRDYDIPAPESPTASASRATKDITDAVNAPIPDDYIGAVDRLNSEQRCAYDCIMDAVLQNHGGAFFVDGPAGTGKTFLYCALYTQLRLRGKIVLPTATSGIAASNIPTGRTAHSRFKIPIDTDGSFSCNVSKQSSLAGLLRAADLFIWDEASMAKKEDIEALDALLQDICSNTNPFGGKVVVFGGDFRQVMPVIPHKGQSDAITASLVSSYLWPILHRFHLTENIRARADPDFSSFLLNLGDGRYQSQESSWITLPSDIVVCSEIEADSVDSIVDAMFPEMHNLQCDPQVFSYRAILTPTNDCVDSINDILIRRFHGNTVTYTGIDTIIDDNSSLCTPEFLNTLCPSGMSPHKLVLKQNCPVILLRNLDPSCGLCNGTRLICKSFQKNIIICQIANGYYKDQLVFIPRINLRPASATKYPFKFQRKQFPIKLCFAMTINKAQGQTLQRVCVYLRQSCFSHGQLYVAFSRARKRSDLTVFVSNSVLGCMREQVIRNVVSFELLRRAGINLTH